MCPGGIIGGGMCGAPGNPGGGGPAVANPGNPGGGPDIKGCIG